MCDKINLEIENCGKNKQMGKESDQDFSDGKIIVNFKTIFCVMMT